MPPQHRKTIAFPPNANVNRYLYPLNSVDRLVTQMYIPLLYHSNNRCICVHFDRNPITIQSVSRVPYTSINYAGKAG